MLSLGLGLSLDAAAFRLQAAPSAPQPPASFDWPAAFAFDVQRDGASYSVNLDPQALVAPAIWSAPALHVDAATGDDANTGQGADGDFSQAKRTIHAAFTAGNATGAPYRVLVKAGRYEESAFSRNGKVEPNQPVAVIGWGGRVSYLTGPHNLNWLQDGGTYKTTLSAVNRAFRRDVLTADGDWSELTQVADQASCAATSGSWFKDGSTIHVNLGNAPGAEDVALIRNFHGARFLNHADDLYLENLDIAGGISGALHCDASANRNIVAKNCSFRYSSPSNVASPQNAVNIRRTAGLIAFFDSVASFGAKDGWGFHEDGNPGAAILLVNCRSHGNGAFGATSCNALTAHDNARMAAIGGDFGGSCSGSDVHLIQTSQGWLVGASVGATGHQDAAAAVKVSNTASIWLDDCAVSAPAGQNALEANGGNIYLRATTTISGTQSVSAGGEIASY